MFSRLGLNRWGVHVPVDVSHIRPRSPPACVSVAAKLGACHVSVPTSYMRLGVIRRSLHMNLSHVRTHSPLRGASVTVWRRCQATSSQPVLRAQSGLNRLAGLGVTTAAFIVALSVYTGGVEADADSTGRLSDNESVRKTKQTYEHKIRTLSPVERRFKYFATIQCGECVYMTAKDLIDSLVGGNLQPNHLQHDKYAIVEGTYKEASHMIPFAKDEEALHAELCTLIGKDALISFSDYVFLLSMMNYDARRFELAFKMFDQDGNGNIDRAEFRQVQTVTQHAARASKALTSAKRSMFEERFFQGGPGSSLSFGAFLPFFLGVRKMVSKFEFHRHSKKNAMTVPEFVHLVFGMRGLKPSEFKEIAERAKGATKVTLDYQEFSSFNNLLSHLDDVSTAISLYSASGRDLTKDDLHRAAAVAGVEVSHKLINLLFVLFDTDGDGTLSDKEFVKAMSQSASNRRRAASVSFARTFGGLLECMKSLSSGN